MEAAFIQYEKAFGPLTDIPATDVGTDKIVTSWFVDQYLSFRFRNSPDKLPKRLVDEFKSIDLSYDPEETPFYDHLLGLVGEYPEFGHKLGVITNKLEDKGGSQGREAATGNGIFFTLKEALRLIGAKVGIGEDVKGKTVAIQGSGNVAMYFALAAYKAGMIIQHINNKFGGITNLEGIDIEALHKWRTEQLEYLREEGIREVDLNEFPGTHEILTGEILEQKVDVLVPAALGNVITAENAESIQAKLIIEGANGPIDKAADKILNDRGVIIIPDILANAGGVVVSYYEWVQNLSRAEQLDESVINTKLRKPYADSDSVNI